MPISTCKNCKKEFKHHHASAGKYCGIECMGEHYKQIAIDKNRPLFEEGKLKRRDQIKPFIIERDGYECSECGISEWRGKPLTLWLDHIDGDASNNLPDNFRLMCPNCDSQTETFGAKNTGKGRKSRGLPQYG